MKLPTESVLMICVTAETTTPTRASHQNSLRLARPEKVAYFFQNRRTA